PVPAQEAHPAGPVEVRPCLVQGGEDGQEPVARVLARCGGRVDEDAPVAARQFGGEPGQAAGPGRDEHRVALGADGGEGGLRALGGRVGDRLRDGGSAGRAERVGLATQQVHEEVAAAVPDDDAVGYPGLEQGPYGDQAVDQPFRGVPLGGGRLGGGDPGGAFGAPVGERREGTGPGGGRARFGGVLVGQQCDQRGGVRRVADRGGAGGQPLQRLGRLLGRGGGDAGPPALVVAPGGLHEGQGGEGRGLGVGPQVGGEPGRVAAQGRLAARGERHQEPAVPGGGLAGRDRRLLQDEVHV